MSNLAKARSAWTRRWWVLRPAPSDGATCAQSSLYTAPVTQEVGAKVPACRSYANRQCRGRTAKKLHRFVRRCSLARQRPLATSR